MYTRVVCAYTSVCINGLYTRVCFWACVHTGERANAEAQTSSYISFYSHIHAGTKVEKEESYSTNLFSLSFSFPLERWRRECVHVCEGGG